MFVRIGSLIGLLAFSACLQSQNFDYSLTGGSNVPPGSTNNGAPPSGSSYAQAMQVMTQRCGGSTCHGGWINQPESFFVSTMPPLIVPGDVQNSKLYLRLQGSEYGAAGMIQNMPYNMPALSSSERAILRNWISGMTVPCTNNCDGGGGGTRPDNTPYQAAPLVNRFAVADRLRFLFSNPDDGSIFGLVRDQINTKVMYEVASFGGACDHHQTPGQPDNCPRPTSLVPSHVGPNMKREAIMVKACVEGILYLPDDGQGHFWNNPSAVSLMRRVVTPGQQGAAYSTINEALNAMNRLPSDVEIDRAYRLFFPDQPIQVPATIHTALYNVTRTPGLETFRAWSELLLTLCTEGTQYIL